LYPVGGSWGKSLGNSIIKSKVSAVGIDAHLFTSALVSNTLEHLNVHPFNGLENGTAELEVDGVVSDHDSLSLTFKV